MTASELAEWQAYEAYEGPLGQQYNTEMLIQIQELLQLILRVNVISSGGKDSQVTFQSVNRPWYEAKEEKTEEVKQEDQKKSIAQFAQSFKRKK